MSSSCRSRNSTPEDRLSICISIVATHIRLLSHHHTTTTTFKAYNSFLCPHCLTFPYANLSTTLQHHPQQQPHRSRQHSSRQYAKISVSLLSISSSFPVYELFPLYLLCRHFSQSTFTTKSTTITSAMGRVRVTAHHLPRPSTDFLQGGYN